MRGSGRFRRLGPRFGRRSKSLNPLHCGAVVASRLGAAAALMRQPVLIPFIAGQWSLPNRDGARRRAPGGSQSPSLRGSGRFGALAARAQQEAESQSPSLRGSGRFADRGRPPARGGRVSIPFIAGQWSLPRRRSPPTRLLRVSQSPSLRGSGRFLAIVGAGMVSALGLNPLHCGAVVASWWWRGCSKQQPSVSIPFIAGQWSLRVVAGRARHERARLNPLHCGAVVASQGAPSWSRTPMRVSIPFIAGQWSLHFADMDAVARFHVSIPFIAGQWSLLGEALALLAHL